jgi:hypothetical protein
MKQRDVYRIRPQVITHTQCDDLAARIAAVLIERKKVRAKRRRKELEYQRRNSERALARYRRLTTHRSAFAVQGLNNDS